MGWIYDVGFFVLLFLFFIFGARKGMFKSIVNIIVFIVGAIISVFIARNVSEVIFDNILTHKMNEIMTPEVQSQLSANTLTKDLVTAYNTGIDVFISVAKPFFVNLVAILAFIPICFLCGLLIKLILKIIFSIFGKKRRGKPHGLDSFLGGIFGILKYLLIICIFCSIIYILSPYSDDSDFFSDETIQSSYVFKYIYNNNPLSVPVSHMISEK